MSGALTMYATRIESLMTEKKRVQSISVDTVLDGENLERIRNIGFSRIPLILSTEHPYVVGILMAKSLIGTVPSENTIW